MQVLKRKLGINIGPETLFVLSSFVVNGGNYLYNLLMGRILGPEAFADVAILITLLLVISFIAMTFQVVVSKFTVEFDASEIASFKKWVMRRAISVGLILGASTIVFSKELQVFFNTSSSTMFLFFGIGIPVYFITSVHRGSLQGSNNFTLLSGSYQMEMWVRLIGTFALLFLLGLHPIESVAIAIAFSFVAGLFPWKQNTNKIKTLPTLSKAQKRQVKTFFFLTAFYECTQIICNNSDILLVKHFFDATESGLYASLALIGRVIYFITWMFVMLLLPKVVSLRKQGEATAPLLLNYVGYISVFASVTTALAFLFPQTAVLLLFGDAYTSIANLLGWYALATSLFAISNIFAYYFLSLDKYIPILCSGLMGIAQVILIVCFHDSLFQVVLMQIIAMAVLLILQLSYFFSSNKK
jgi:O-antigen/teichoic acid export membrane protein